MADGNSWAFDKGYNFGFEAGERIIDSQVAVLGRSEVSDNGRQCRPAKNPCSSARKARLNQPHYSCKGHIQ